MVTISGVIPNSAAEKAGIKQDDIIISINGHDISDVLDYRFRITEETVTLKIHREAELFDVTVKKSEYDDIGLEFATYLMDEKRSCRNKCIFCFIDQNPCGMRETIYFKDDDRRLSFLQGNYITMTNLDETDIEKMIEMRCSPINISIHTTNPELRCMMMNNRFAGKALGYMQRLAEADIEMSGQIVLCKGVNDGDELLRTMTDLEALYPQMSSVSIVPAGMTKHRDGLYPLEQFTSEEAGAVIDAVDAYAEKCIQKHDSRIFFCSDELYLIAERELPKSNYYEGYPQIANGVGLITSMQDEFDDELDFLDDYDLEKERDISIATGKSAYMFISSLAHILCNRIPTLKISVYRIDNDFFGHSVTVAGLVTGGDIAAQLADKHLGTKLLLPSVMLRASGDLFLDGITPAELSEKLGVEVCFNEPNGYEFIKAILD